MYMKFDGQDDLSVCIRIFGSKSDKYSNRYTFLDATNILLFVFSRLFFIYNNLQKS